MSRFFSVLGWALLCIGICVVTISFWFTLPISWAFQPLLFLTILLVVLHVPERAIACAALSGVMLDLFSVLPFGVFTVSLVGSVTVVIFSQQTLLKGHAAHTVLIHTILASLLYHLLFGIGLHIAQALGSISEQSIPTVGRLFTVACVQTALYLCGVVLAYGSSVIFQKRFIQTAQL
jgi:flagellar biosynthesis protein FliQ